ncbi:MAG: hypothetical protein ABMA64_26895 [Myxococcota bacterium]
MSTTISIRVWWSDQPSPTEATARLTEALAPSMARPWGDASVRDSQLRVLHSFPLGADPGAVLRADDTATRNGFSVRIATTSSASCWRFAPGRPPAREGVALTAVGWDAAWLQQARFDRRVEGDGAVLVDPVGPFCALLDEGSEAVNEKIEQNLEALIGWVQALALHPKATRIGVGTDAGDPIPVNWHLAWYPSAEALAEDAAYVRELARSGLAAYQIPPLASRDAADSPTTLHGWRSSEQRAALAERLGERLGATSPTAERVTEVLRSGRFDWMEGPGILALDYPHPFNAFLDRLYLEILSR